MRKSKNRYFYHIFVSPGDAPGAITLSVVRMEREFDAYKLSRCTCPSKYNRFWDTARYLWKKSAFYHTPLHSTPPLGGFPSEYRHPLWYWKTRMVSLPDGEKKFEDIFIRFGATHERDGRTDRQTDIRWQHTALMHMHRAVKIRWGVRPVGELTESVTDTHTHTHRHTHTGKFIFCPCIA